MENKTEAQKLQEQIDCTTRGEVIADLYSYPFAVRDGGSQKRLVMAKNHDVCITKWNSQYVTCSGLDALKAGGEQIPLSDFLNELESLIADVRRAHGLNHVASVHQMEEDFIPESQL